MDTHTLGNRRDLAFKPEVRAQHPARNRACGRVVDGCGQWAGANMNAGFWVEVGKRTVHACGVHPAHSGDAGRTMTLRHLDLHAYQGRTFCVFVNHEQREKCEIADSGTNMQTYRMARPRKPRYDDPWKQRDRFMFLVDAKVKSGVPLEEVARELGLKTVNSLEVAYRYDHRRIPSRNTIKRAAKYFGVPESELYGEEDAQLDELILARSLALNAMGADAVGKLTSEQLIEAYKIALATAKAVLAK